ncbi:MAG TPA: cytochrome c oxidase subunit 3 [Phycisphaerae bacterium]|nr:cytochrome c oxidase subunit 3 [Phycisphaerae bacterium]
MSTASAEALPHTLTPHPVTGMYNGKFGLWLFLASEIMLFGALFSSYVLLRVNGAFPHHGTPENSLSVPIGTLNTMILITSSVTMVLAWASFKLNKPGKGRLFLLLTMLLAMTFLVIKIIFEYRHKYHMGIRPDTSTFYAIYYCMTGLHGLHILGGIIVIGYFLLPGFGLWKKNPEQFTNRIECTGLYWHFVDLVWIFLFPVFYLL